MRKNISVLFAAFSLATYVIIKEGISYACEEDKVPKSIECQFLYMFLKTTVISTPPTTNPIWETLGGTIKAIKNIKKNHFKNLNIFVVVKDHNYWMFHWVYVVEDIKCINLHYLLTLLSIVFCWIYLVGDVVYVILGYFMTLRQL